MKVVDVLNAEPSPNPHGVHTARIYDTEHAQAVHILLHPGESLKRHITPVDVFFYVLEGEGTVEIGGERRKVGRDNLVESPARIPHRWMNDGGRICACWRSKCRVQAKIRRSCDKFRNRHTRT